MGLTLTNPIKRGEIGSSHPKPKSMDSITTKHKKKCTRDIRLATTRCDSLGLSTIARALSLIGQSKISCMVGSWTLRFRPYSSVKSVKIISAEIILAKALLWSSTTETKRT